LYIFKRALDTRSTPMIYSTSKTLKEMKRRSRTMNEKASILDMYDIAEHLQLGIEDTATLLKHLQYGYECNGVVYVKTEEIEFSSFCNELTREASAYIKRQNVLEYIEDHPGCNVNNIKEFLEEDGSTSHRDVVDHILTLLTKENQYLYEEEGGKFFVHECNF
jgi:hypothetical protein